MRDHKIIYKNNGEIPSDELSLIEHALEATFNAYAPYSNFNVGAAILLDDGSIIKGANQENAAFPSGLCAERVAIFHIMNSFPNQKILKIAITARKEKSTDHFPAAPCGGCRQVMLEQEQKQGKPIEVIFQSNENWIKISSTLELLPYSFDKNSLK
ncbi:MAG: cytidine deaminase [Cyclobacteriaceae bacterium]|nr:cytidine deaminase [Cyclobacteriaceae bacterium]